MRFEIFITSFMSCSTSTTAMPCAAIRRISRSISSVSTALQPAAGSSSSSTLRLGRERARDLQPLQRAIGQAPAGRSAASRKPDQRRAAPARASRVARFWRATDGQAEQIREHVAVLLQMAADHHVLQRGHAEEDLQVLERARQPARAPADAAADR